MFPTNLSRVPPDSDNNICIHLELDTYPISITSYTMASTKLRDLHAQLQELLGKGFIHPSTSPWASFFL